MPDPQVVLVQFFQLCPDGSVRCHKAIQLLLQVRIFRLIGSDDFGTETLFQGLEVIYPEDFEIRDYLVILIGEVHDLWYAMWLEEAPLILDLADVDR